MDSKPWCMLVRYCQGRLQSAAAALSEDMQVVCLDLKVLKVMVKRTKKTFTDYNQYRDRPFGLKWATAYAMDGVTRFLTSALTRNRNAI